jgi:hypothetical protein
MNRQSRGRVFGFAILLAGLLSVPAVGEDVRLGPLKTLDEYFPFTPPADAAAGPRSPPARSGLSGEAGAATSRSAYRRRG